MEFKTRKCNRKKGFDYSSEQIYFVTICTNDKTHDFGLVEKDCMILNGNGRIAEEQIHWLEAQYPYLEIHNAVVMPNHVHILFQIDIRKEHQSLKIKSVSELMGAYKTTVSKMIHLNGHDTFRWQWSFHDHIVRDANGYENIYHYISDNPVRWHNDVHNNSKITTVGTSCDLS
ncbi:MAG: transposase [Paludibacter sp.]|jgi:putative transposase